MSVKPDLIKIAALPINKDGQLLIVKWKNKPIWFSLGGVLEENETEEECLRREVKEELNAELIGDITHYCDTPIEKAAGRDATIIIKFYLVKLPDSLKVDDDEIEEYRWLSKKSYETLLNDRSIEIGSGLTKFAIPKLLQEKIMR